MNTILKIEFKKKKLKLNISKLFELHPDLNSISKVEFKKYLKKKYTSKRLTLSELKGFKFKIKHEKIGPNGEANAMAGY